MLQSLSDGAKGGITKFILVGFLFLAVLGLVLTDVGGFFRDGVGSTDIAEVEGETVSVQEFDRYLRRFLSQQGLTVDNAYRFGVIPSILDGYIQERIVVQHAHELGIRVPDQEVANQIRRFVEPFVDEQTSPQDALNRLLSTQGVSEREFANNLKRGMSAGLMQNTVLSGQMVIPASLLNTNNRFNQETRDIDLIVLEDKGIKIEDPTEEELQEFYDAAKEQYAIPEMRTFTLATLNPESLQGDVSVSDEDVLDYYENHIHLYNQSRRRDIEQVVVQTEEAANELLETVRAGKPLKEASAKDTHQVTENIEESGLPESLAGAIFDDENKENLIGPLQTPLGWHIIQLNSDIKEGPKPFEDVKSDIKQTLEEDKRSQIVFDTVDAIDDLIDDGVNFEELIETYKLETVSVGPIDKVGLNEKKENAIKPLGSDTVDVLEIAFNLYENEISSILELADGRFAFVKIEEIKPKETKPLEDLKDTLASRLKENKQKTENWLRATTLYSKLNQGEITLKEAANETKTSLIKLRKVKRVPGDTVPKPLTFAAHSMAFNMEAGKYIISRTATGAILALPNNVKLPEADAPISAANDNDAEQIKLQIANELSNEIMTTYMNKIKKNTDVRVNQGLIDQMYGLDDVSPGAGN